MAEQESKTSLRTRKRITKKNVLKQKPKPPSYKEMIRLALFDLKEAKGTSRDDILNYICAKYDIKINAIASRRLNVALKAGVSDGTFKKSKGTNKMVDRYFIGVTKVLETRKVGRKPAKMGLRMKTKTVKKSKPQQNKCRIKPQEKRRAGKKVQLVKSQVKSKRKSPEQEVLSKSDVEQLSTSTDEKVENQSTDIPHTSEEITELRNE